MTERVVKNERLHGWLIANSPSERWVRDECPLCGGEWTDEGTVRPPLADIVNPDRLTDLAAAKLLGKVSEVSVGVFA